jgi:rod shape-determining protein MreC
MTLLLVVVTSLALISLDKSGVGVIGTARSGAQDVVAPLQNLADDAINPVRDFFDGLGRGNELEAENAKLRRELAAAQAQVQAGEAATRQLQEISGLLDLPQVSDYDGVVASVVDGPTDNFARTLQLDKGSDAGIKVDMPVVVADGLVGKVIRVSKTRAVVLRLDDPAFGVTIQLLKKDALGPSGFANGQKASTLLKLTTLASNQDLDKGELAVTSGVAGSIFPKGLSVGTVTRKVDAASATQQEAQLQPVVDLDRLDLVKVLLYRPQPTP